MTSKYDDVTPKRMRWIVNRTMQGFLAEDPDAYNDCGAIRCTKLTEDVAQALELNYEGGPLDEPTHWIWDIAPSLTPPWRKG